MVTERGEDVDDDNNDLGWSEKDSEVACSAQNLTVPSSAQVAMTGKGESTQSTKPVSRPWPTSSKAGPPGEVTYVRGK